MILDTTINTIADKLECLNIDNGIELTARIDINTHSKLLRQYKKANFVYFIIEGQQVIYVGSTTNISTRISQHKKDKVFSNVLLIKYDTYENMYFAEKAIINSFKPVRNKKIYINQ